MELGDYIAAAREKPWEWSVHDCSAFPAIWAGMADALPPYTTEEEAEAMLRDAGGLVPLWTRAAEGRAEEVPLSDVRPGDVGVIEAIGPDMKAIEIGAIWTGKRWAFVPLRGGVAAASAHCLKAWRPMCRKR